MHAAANAIKKPIHARRRRLTQLRRKLARPIVDGSVKVQLVQQPLAFLLRSADANYIAAVQAFRQLADQIADATGGCRHDDGLAAQRFEDLVESEQGDVAVLS